MSVDGSEERSMRARTYRMTRLLSTIADISKESRKSPLRIHSTQL